MTKSIPELENINLHDVIGLLPESLQGAIYGYNLYSNLPLELCLSSAFSVANFVSQKHYNVEPLEFGTRPLSEFLVVMQPRSGGKSSAYDTYLKPITDLMSNLAARHSIDMEDYAFDKAIYEKKLKQAKEDGDIPEKPKKPAHYDPFVSAPTLNGLINHMMQCSNAGIFSDEGSKFINGYDNREAQSNISLASSLCDVWNGRDLKYDTGTDKKRMFNRRCNLFLLVQKSEAAKLVANDRFESLGLESRLLVVDCPKWIRLEIDENTPELKKQGGVLMEEYYKRIQKLMTNNSNTMDHDPCELDLPSLKWCDDVHPLRIDWFNMSTRLFNDDDNVPKVASGLVSKMYEHTCRLAGTLCVYDGRDSISVQDWKAGEALMKFFIYQRLSMGQIDDVSTMDKTVLAETKLIEWFGENDGSVSKQRISQFGPYAYRKLHRDAKAKIIDGLLMDGILELEGKNLKKKQVCKKEAGLEAYQKPQSSGKVA